MVFSKNLTFPTVFDGLYDDFRKDLKGIEQAKAVFKCISIISCISAFFTLIIVYKASSRIKAEYRQILFAQLSFACFGCFLITFISPSVFLPYPLIFLSGPFAIDYRFTLYFSAMVVMLYFFPTMLLLSFGLIYNFMSLKQLSSHFFNISLDRLMKFVLFGVTMLLLIGNFILITQIGGEKDQKRMQTEILENDIRCIEIFQKYAGFVFDIYSWPILVASIEALVLSLASVMFCVGLTALSCKHFESQKATLSPASARNHRMMLYMLITYVAHFLIYFSFPLATFTWAIHISKPFFGSLTFLLIISPAHFLGITLSLAYCTIITPYRKVVIAIIVILTCSHTEHFEEPNRPSLSLSTIDSFVRRYSYRMTNQVSNGSV